MCGWQIQGQAVFYMHWLRGQQEADMPELSGNPQGPVRHLFGHGQGAEADRDAARRWIAAAALLVGRLQEMPRRQGDLRRVRCHRSNAVPQVQGRGRNIALGDLRACTEGRAPCPRCRLVRTSRSSRSPDAQDCFVMLRSIVAPPHFDGAMSVTAREASDRSRYWLEANAERSDGVYAFAKQQGPFMVALPMMIEAASKQKVSFLVHDMPFEFAARDQQQTLIVSAIDIELEGVTGTPERRRERARAIAKSIIAPTLLAVHDSYIDACPPYLSCGPLPGDRGGSGRRSEP